MKRLSLPRAEGRVGHADAQRQPHHRVARSGHACSTTPYLAYIGPEAAQDLRMARATRRPGRRRGDRRSGTRTTSTSAAVLPMLQQAGVTIMAGTDAGFLNSFNYPGIGLHDELALYVENGLTPAQALSSATRAGPALVRQARSLRRDRRGQGRGPGAARPQSAGGHPRDAQRSTR